MLRRICGACGSIIDGEPQLDKEYADAVLVIDDEVVDMYDDLCDKCKNRLRSLFIRIEKPTEIEPRQTIEPEPESKPEPEPEAEAEILIPEPEPAPEPTLPQKHIPLEPIDKDALPNKVTKQIPIVLRTRDSD